MIAKCRARVVSVWRNLVHRDRVDRLLDEELRATVDLLVDERVSAGMRPDEARRVARLELGSLESLKDEVHDARTGAGIDAIVRDIRYALRQFRRSRASRPIAIATLALGIGANTAMFSAVDAVLIRPLPYADADRLVMIWDDLEPDRLREVLFHAPEWPEWRRHNTVFTDIAATQPGDATLSGDGEPGRTAGPQGHRQFLDACSAHSRCSGASSPKTKTREACGWPSSAMGSGSGVSARRPTSSGRTITLNDTPYKVIGVMPREFYFMPARDIDIWMPTSFSAGMLRNWGWHDVHCVARLKPGVTLRAGPGIDGRAEPARVGATREACRARLS